MRVLSSSDVVNNRGLGEIVLRPFRPDYFVRPELRVNRSTIVDADAVQVCLRRLLIDVRRGAHNAPYCDDVGHLPTHTGNFVVTFNSIVHSDHEPNILLRAAILRGVWSNNHRTNESPPER